MRQIALYGKGGIGKSTVASNVSAAFAEMGLKVLQVGCDPKHDSTRNLVGGKILPTVLDAMRQAKEIEDINIKDVLFEGFAGVTCIEAGGPEPGIGCAGRGIIVAIEILEQHGLYEQDFDIVIYDVLGDVVCGGFAMPIREGKAEEIYTITSDEFMPIYAANNICYGIRRFARRGKSRLAGVIGNSRNGQPENETLNKFSRRIGAKLIGLVPYDSIVKECEIEGMTTIEGAPDSEIANSFRALSKAIYQNRLKVIPTPLEPQELELYLSQGT